MYRTEMNGKRCSCGKRSRISMRFCIAAAVGMLLVGCGAEERQPDAGVLAEGNCDLSLRMTKKQKNEKSRKNLANPEKWGISGIQEIQKCHS